MVAGGRHGLLKGGLARSSVQQADAAPGFILVQPVEAVTGRDAGLAAGAGVQVHGESVLLARARLAGGQQRAVMLCLRGERAAFVLSRKPFHCGEALLLQDQLVNQRARGFRGWRCRLFGKKDGRF